MARRKRRFGRVRRLPSGRFQARYPGPDGLLRPGPQTFATRTDAERWLSVVEAELMQGTWLDPIAGQVPLGEYAERWINERPGLAPKTVVLYEGLLRRHIRPALGDLAVADVTPAGVRSWRASLLDDGTGRVTVAKAYRLLKAVLTTAVDDDLIRRNPCRIKGAGTERSPERPTVTIEEVYAIAGGVSEWFSALVLLAAFCGLRWGELIALRCRHLELDGDAVVHVRGSVSEVDGKFVEGPPKSEAGRRDVTIPSVIVAELRKHLGRWSEAGPDGRVFVGPKGGIPRRTNFQATWVKATRAAGVPGLHFHDLRHTGNTLAAESASLRELMARMGHSSTRAALIYQHASRERERAIGAAISARVQAARQAPKGHARGTDAGSAGKRRRPRDEGGAADQGTSQASG
jgi:integrase